MTTTTLSRATEREAGKEPATVKESLTVGPTCNGDLHVGDAIAFLEEAARYFENRPTHGEDRAHWSNVYNAENCRKIAVALRAFPVPPC